MKQAGQIALVPFPFTDLNGSKLRPVLLIRQASSQFDDWLVCMFHHRSGKLNPILMKSSLPKIPISMTQA